MNRFLRIVLPVSCVVSVIVPLSGGAEEAGSDRVHPRPLAYVAPLASTPPVIDGRLDDPAWATAPWTSDFVDIEGDAKPRPAFRTRAKMLWDDSCFYIGAELEEPHVWATLRKRDTVIFYDNDFEVFLDPNGDNHEYYEFEMNALNTGWDLFLPLPYKDGGKAVDAWDIEGLRTAVHIRGTLNSPVDVDSGWSVELAIPWRALAEYARTDVPPRRGDQWRVNFSRVEWDAQIVDGWYRKVPGRPEHNWVWSPQGVIDMHRPERWGTVQFAVEPGTLFVADESWPLREALMDVYYAQVKFREAHKRWAETPEELTLPASAQAFPLRLERSGTGYRASIDRQSPAGTMERFSVNHESRLWKEFFHP